MARKVSRLLLDVQPLWIVLLPFAGLGLLGIDLTLIAIPRSPATSTAILAPWMAFFPSSMFAMKFPLWRTLPLSPRERAQAYWWIWAGIPAAWMILTLVGARTVFQLAGWRCVSWPDTMGRLGAQLLWGMVFSGLIAAGATARQKTSWRGGIVTVAVFGAVFWLSTFTRNLTGPVTDARLILAGALALALAGAAYVWTGPLTAAFAALLRTASRWRSSPPSRATITGPRLRGWGALLPYVLSICGLSVGLGVGFNYFVFSQVRTAHSPHDMAGVQLMMVGMILPMIAASMIPYSVRAMRALPLSAVALTMVLQGYMLFVVALTFSAIWGLAAVTNADTSQLPIFLWATIPIMGLRLPLVFRMGVQNGAFVGIVPIVIMPFLQFVSWSDSPAFIALELGATALTWVWTWWELAYGHDAYEPPPAVMARWRGGSN